jgi:hypothetical protein
MHAGPADQAPNFFWGPKRFLTRCDRQQPWFKGIEQGGKQNPSQAERIRYAVQQRGGSKDQVKGVDQLIDELVAQIGRQTYSVGSGALHAGAAQAKVRKLTGWVFAILDEILPD